MNQAFLPSRKSVAIIQHSPNRDGSAFSGLLVANGLKEAGYQTTVIFSCDGPVIERYLTAGHAVRIVPHMNWLRTRSLPRFIKYAWMELGAARRLTAELARLQPDLVYVNSTVSLAGAIAGRNLGLPVIWHLRELFEDIGGEMRIPRLLRPLVSPIIRRYSNRQAVVSTAVATNILGHHQKSAVLVPNAGGTRFDAGPPADSAILNPPSPDRPRPLVIGVPGTLRPIKGHLFLFNALPAILARFPDTQVIVTGDGDRQWTRTLRERVDELALGNHVQFIGSQDDMPAFYNRCDVVCIPSQAEGFGRTVIESFALGVPVVASKVSGISEIVGDGVSGLLVPYGDTHALAQSLCDLLGSPELRQRLARAARQRYLAEYHTGLCHARICSLVAATCGQIASAPLSPPLPLAASA